MRKLFILIIVILFSVLAGTVFAVDKTVTLQWEQDCVNGCPEQNIGPVEEWRVYMSDVSGVYTTPIITMPYDGTPAPNYSSSYVLTLEGAGTKYFVVRAWNSSAPESGNSNEVNYPYNFSGAATPVNLTFTISTP